jgi:hypothetical protein
LVVTLALVSFCSSGSLRAVEVTGITGGAGLGTVFTLGAWSVSTPTENNISVLGGAGAAGPANTITIPITILAKHIPFEIGLTVEESGSPSFATPNRTSYTVSFDITHGVPTGGAINGFDITAVGSAFPVGHTLTPPLSSPFTIEDPQPFSGGTYRFGGISGGGSGQLLFGDSSTSSIGLLLTADGGTASPITRSLELVANPEPGSILLGSLALVPIGIAVRRRRKQQVVAE